MQDIFRIHPIHQTLSYDNMASKEHLHLHIFQRDLRLRENLAIAAANRRGYRICPIFIFDPRQLEPHPYFSSNGLHFLLDSLEDLHRELLEQNSQLFVFRGLPQEVLPNIFKALEPQSCSWSKDVTPFAKEKSNSFQDLCRQYDMDGHEVDHLFLNDIDAIHKDDGKPYTVFTPYFRKACRHADAPLPSSKTSLPNFWIKPQKKLCPEHMDEKDWKKLRPETTRPLQKGGRHEGLKQLKLIPAANIYDQERDIPHLPSTSKLSAHLKFGTLNPIEVKETLKQRFSPDHPIIRQLYWRDFLSQIAFQFPKVFRENFQPKTHHIQWPNPKGHFEAWSQGKTGFPIVDAGIRELITTGNMHNRVRMITASFLVKDLHVDWRSGERFFAKYLTDYDPALNNGNWQWAASTGCDAQPYFRIFNPWLQQKKFDPEAKYILTWLPELKGFSAKQIHKHEAQPLETHAYPSPMVQHKEAANIAKSLFVKED